MKQSFEIFFKEIKLELALNDFSWDEPFIIEICITNACEQNNLPRLQQLLKYAPNLLVTANQLSILMHAQSPEAVQLIIDKAKEMNCLNKLISITITKKFTVFDYFCINERFDLIAVLMQIGNFDRYTNISRLLSHMRSYYFKSKDNNQLIDMLCIKLREFNHTPRPLSLTFDEKRDQIDFFTSASILHKPGIWYFGPASSKKNAVENAIIELFSLLSTPKMCIAYLQVINWELKRYYQKKHGVAFPKVNRDNIVFEKINGVDYPIPTSDYTGIKKNSALQECLSSILNARGLSKKTYKWIGFIPHEIADEMVKQGDFVVECRLGTGLFHTKTAHMLQFVLLIYAIESNKIPVKYREKSKIKSISALDILQALITEKIQTNTQSYSLWSIVFDSRKDNCAFTDPFRLGSMLMLYRDTWQIEALSDALVDTFCKGFIRLVSTLNESNPSLQLTHTCVIAQLNDMELESFSQLSLYNDSIKKETQRTDGHNILQQPAPGARYAIVEKKYVTNPSFQPLRLTSFFPEQNIDRIILLSILAIRPEKAIKMPGYGLKNSSGKNCFLHENNGKKVVKMDEFGLKKPSGLRHLFWSNNNETQANQSMAFLADSNPKMLIDSFS